MTDALLKLTFEQKGAGLGLRGMCVLSQDLYPFAADEGISKPGHLPALIEPEDTILGRYLPDSVIDGDLKIASAPRGEYDLKLVYRELVPRRHLIYGVSGFRCWAL